MSGETRAETGSAAAMAGPAGQRALSAAAGRLGLDQAGLELRRLARGVTHETLLVERDGRPVAALRLAPPHDRLLPGHAPAAEADLLRALAGSGVPVPEVLIADRDGSVLGRPGLLVSYVEGHNARSWRELRELGGEAAAEHALAILLSLHRVDPARWAGPADAGDQAARELAEWEAVAREAGEAAPAVVGETIAALAAAPPAPPPRACCVHGDYRPANLMVTAGAVTGVLDWEMAAVGDPACDLGIATMATWGTWWPDDELLARYGSNGGARIEPAVLRWWRCLGYAKVAAFLARRASRGWGRAPALKPFVEGMLGARGEWEKLL